MTAAQFLYWTPLKFRKINCRKSFDVFGFAAKFPRISIGVHYFAPSLCYTSVIIVLLDFFSLKTNKIFVVFCRKMIIVNGIIGITGSV